MTDYTIYGFINLDWTIQWKDYLSNNQNGAVFKDGPTLPGSYTFYTKPTDTSGGGTVKPEFYFGILDNIYLYNSVGGIVNTQTGSASYDIQMKYTTQQYGNYFFDSNRNLVYLNLDKIDISDMYIPVSGGGTVLISDFKVKFDLYKTLYESNFDNNLTKTDGCKVYDNYKISETTTNNDGNQYKVYIGNGILIPENLRNMFSIDYKDSLNIFTNIKSNAILNITEGTYWNYFTNYYGNPTNTGWIIINIKIP